MSLNQMQMLEANILLETEIILQLNEGIINRKIKNLNVEKVLRDIEYCDNIARKYLQIPIPDFTDLDKHETKRLYRKFKIQKISRRFKNGLFGAGLVLSGLVIKNNNLSPKEIQSDEDIPVNDLISGATIGGIAGFIGGAFFGVITDNTFIMKETLRNRDIFIRVNKNDDIYEVLIPYRKNGKKLILRSFKLTSKHFF